MGRRNSPAVLARWAEVSLKAPFRATLGRDIVWEIGLPPPALLDACRVLPGGRLIAAFHVAEVRDYFVEGHAHQGARVEADWAEVGAPAPASSRKDRTSPAMRLEDLIAEGKAAAKARRHAEAAVEAAFAPDAMEHLAAGRLEEAMAILASLPGNCVAKTLLLSRLHDAGAFGAGAPTLDRVNPAPLTPDRARALLLWQRAQNANARAAAELETKAYPHAKALLATQGIAAVEQFRTELAGTMAAVWIGDLIYVAKNPSAAVRRGAATSVPSSPAS